MMTNTQKGFTAIYVTILLLATNGLFAKGLPLSALDTTVVRSVIAGFFLLIIIMLLGNRQKRLSRKDIFILGGLGVFLSIHWLTFFESMRVSSVAIGMTALYTYPIFTVILEAVIARRKVCLRDALLAALVFSGIYIISPLHQNITTEFMGVVLGLISAITFAIRNVMQRKYCGHLSPITAVAVQCFSGALILLPFASPAAMMELDMKTLMSLVLLGTIFTALPHVLMATSLRFLAAKTVAFVGCLQPVVGALIALLVLGEIPTSNVIIGGILILGAAALETGQIGLGSSKYAVRKKMKSL